MDTIALNAAAVDSATQAMLTAGFGGWEEEDEDGLVAGGGGGGGPILPHAAHTMNLAVQHTAAASSLSALPSPAFFAALRIGEGVDALDIIGAPQWRHAIILDSRHEEQEWRVRWAGWDVKWDEWIHCLRLAPAHSKVLGDTGPEDSSERTLCNVLGREWYSFLQANPGLLANVHLKIDGVAPWISMKQSTEAPTRDAFEMKQDQATPPRQFASATPPSSHASLDDEEADADDGFSLSLSPSAFRHTAPTASPTLTSSYSATASPVKQPSASRALPSTTLDVHECFLRVRAPRVFKFLRQNADAFSPTMQQDARNGWTDELEAKRDDALPNEAKQSATNGKSPAGSPLKPKTSASGAQTSRLAVGHAIPSAYVAPPSARLAKSTSVSGLTSGSQTARTLTRQSSVTSVAPTRKSTGTIGGVPRTPTRSGSTSNPISPPNLVHAASQPIRKSTGSTTARASPPTIGTPSRTRTPNVSAPATPRLKPTTPGTPVHAAAAASSPSKSKFRNVQSKLNTGRPATSGVAVSSTPATTAAAKKRPKRSISDPAVTDSVCVTPLLSPASATHQRTPSASSIATSISDDSNGAPDHESTAVARSSLISASTPAASPSAILFPAQSGQAQQPSPTSPSVGATASAFTSPKDDKKDEEKEQPAAASTPSRSPLSPAARPKHKTLVLPLSSAKALRAFVEYLYTDGIAKTAVGERKPTDASAPKPKKPSATRLHGSRNIEEEWADADSNPTVASTAASSSSSASTGMSIVDLFELACLASSLHDPRLMCLTAIQIQRTLSPSNIMQALQILDQCGALQSLDQRPTALSVHLNGCLAPAKTDHATHPVSKNASASPMHSPVETDPTAIPPAFLVPDTPATFLRSNLNLCGVSPHDFDILTRIVLDFLALQWTTVFGGGDGANMKLLHSFPFPIFQLVVNLRNGASSVLGGEARPPQSIEEKAIAAQAQINAALIAAGIQPAAQHNLFSHAAAAAVANGALPGTSTQQELLLQIASPSIALPPCNLVKVFRKLYEQTRNEHTCDVRLVIEDDSAAPSTAAALSASGARSPLPIKATIWAHRVVLAVGSEYFRNIFRASSWDIQDAETGVTTVRFPSSSFTVSSLEAVLRYIYTNSTAGIDFVTALYLMNAHVTNYFGLREFPQSGSLVHSAHHPPVPASFVCDLEKSAIHVLHTSLNASVSPNGALSPLVGDSLSLVYAAYAYGDRGLFEKACVFCDWTHLDLLMACATRKKRAEEQQAKTTKLRRLQHKNERHAARERRQWKSSMAAASAAGVLDFDDAISASNTDSSIDTEDDDNAAASAAASPAPLVPRDGSSLVAPLVDLGELSSAVQFDFIASIIAEKARGAQSQAALKARAAAGAGSGSPPLPSP